MKSTFDGAEAFRGTGLATWQTSSVTDLQAAFNGALQMTAILGSWDVSACKNFKATFQGAANFSAVGIDAWNISSAEKMNYIFDGASAITSCSKRMIADEWTRLARPLPQSPRRQASQRPTLKRGKIMCAFVERARSEVTPRGVSHAARESTSKSTLDEIHISQSISHVSDHSNMKFPPPFQVL